MRDDDSSDSDDELVIWPYGDSEWDAYPESALRAGNYFKKHAPRAGTMPRELMDRSRRMSDVYDARDEYMRGLRRLGEAGREELEDRERMHSKMRKKEERNEARARHGAQGPRSVARYLRMPLETRDLTNVLRGRVEEDAARSYHMQMLDALKEPSPLSPSYEELRDEIFATAYEEPKRIASEKGRGDAWSRHTKRRW
jgi:hypothetical protein